MEIVQWALSNTSLIMWICPVIHKILANEDFTVTNGLISRFFVVAFVHPHIYADSSYLGLYNTT